jgi:hypothetical protein
MGIIALACMFGLIRNLQIPNQHHAGKDIENRQTQVGGQ